MNHITNRNRLEMQLTQYKRYLKECPIESVGKLCIEIAKLEHRLEMIRGMSVEKLMEKVIFQYVTRNSKANKLSQDTAL